MAGPLPTGLLACALCERHAADYRQHVRKNTCQVGDCFRIGPPAPLGDGVKIERAEHTKERALRGQNAHCGGREKTNYQWGGNEGGRSTITCRAAPRDDSCPPHHHHPPHRTHRRYDVCRRLLVRSQLALRWVSFPLGSKIWADAVKERTKRPLTRRPHRRFRKPAPLRATLVLRWFGGIRPPPPTDTMALCPETELYTFIARLR